jgi:hypothetical protein
MLVETYKAKHYLDLTAAAGAIRIELTSIAGGAGPVAHHQGKPRAVSDDITP